MAKRRKRKLSKKEAKALAKKAALPVEPEPEPKNVERKLLAIGTTILVRDLAVKMDIPVTELIGKLIKNGVFVTINQEIDFETAAIVADEFGFELTEISDETKEVPKRAKKSARKEHIPRPPVVTIMGHVDHGKTQLLDTIRKTNIMSKEAGGITQHIGAYQVEVEVKRKKRLITFLDTPGHEAFSSMRAHGAEITDFVVLVVAADEGPKPQTMEAYTMAKQARVPLIVAINKIDRPEADIQATRRQLADLGILLENWGGDIPTVEISAKTGQGIQDLLELILLMADLAELKFSPMVPATGTVIESHIERGLGSVATLIVRDGTLHSGDWILAGNVAGKIRVLSDFRGNRLAAAIAGTPVQIAGLPEAPSVGNTFTVGSRLEAELLAKPSKGHVLQPTTPGHALHLIIKSDTQGTLRAVEQMIKKSPQDELPIEILWQGVGSVAESDVTLAKGIGAVILAFSVQIPHVVQKLAERENVRILRFDIIYELADAVKKMRKDFIEKIRREQKIGEIEILKTFGTREKAQVVGGKVTDGKISSGTDIKILRQGKVIADGSIINIQQNRKDAHEVTAGRECGLLVLSDQSIRIGDILEIFSKTPFPATENTTEPVS